MESFCCNHNKLLLAVVLAAAGLVFLSSPVSAIPTALAPNDVVIVTANGDSGYSSNACLNGPDSNAIDILLRADIGSGTVIHVTDNAWNGTALLSNEGTATFTAATDMPAGSVLRYTDCESQTPGSGWVRSGGFDVSVSGDTLLVYQGSSASPSFLYGFGFRSNSWISSGSPTTNNSWVPNQLTAVAEDAVNQMASNNLRNYQYLASGGYGIYSDSFLADIKNFTNWDTSGAGSAGPHFLLTTVPFDASRPTFTSVQRNSPTTSSTNANSVVFRVITSEPIQAPLVSDFTLNTTGSLSYASASLSAVSGDTYDIAVAGLVGDGTISVASFSGAQLLDLNGNPASDLTFVGEAYSIDQTTPPATTNSLTTNQTSAEFSESAPTVPNTGVELVGDNSQLLAVAGPAAAAGIVLLVLIYRAKYL